MESVDFKKYLINKLLIVALIWVSLSALFQLTMIGFHFTDNQPAIKKVNDWFNSNIDGHFKKT